MILYEETVRKTGEIYALNESLNTVKPVIILVAGLHSNIKMFAHHNSIFLPLSSIEYSNDVAGWGYKFSNGSAIAGDGRLWNTGGMSELGFTGKGLAENSVIIKNTVNFLQIS